MTIKGGNRCIVLCRQGLRVTASWVLGVLCIVTSILVSLSFQSKAQKAAEDHLYSTFHDKVEIDHDLSALASSEKYSNPTKFVQLLRESLFDRAAVELPYKIHKFSLDSNLKHIRTYFRRMANALEAAENLVKKHIIIEGPHLKNDWPGLSSLFLDVVKFLDEKIDEDASQPLIVKTAVEIDTKGNIDVLAAIRKAAGIEEKFQNRRFEIHKLMAALHTNMDGEVVARALTEMLGTKPYALSKTEKGKLLCWG